MSKKYFSDFLLITIILFNIIHKTNCETNSQYCNISLLCENCIKCGDSGNYSDCNYENLFCLKNDKSLDFFENYKSSYSNSFRKITDNHDYKFCGENLISLYSIVDSFTIFSNENNIITNPEKVNIHCDYTINNIYYFENKDNSANINFSVNKNNIDVNKNSNFNVFILPNNNVTQIQIIKYSDIITKSIDINLNKINKLAILIDYGKIENNENINLKISISTNNSIKKNKSNNETRNLIIIFSTIISVVIIIIILWVYYNRKKEIRLQNERRAQIERENNNKIIEAENNFKFLFEQILFPKVFDIKNIINNCINCTICLEIFNDGENDICITPCDHIFHYNCIRKWAEKNKMNLKCPNCKQDLIQRQIIRPITINISNQISDRILINNHNIRSDRTSGVIIFQSGNDDNTERAEERS